MPGLLGGEARGTVVELGPEVTGINGVDLRAAAPTRYFGKILDLSGYDMLALILEVTNGGTSLPTAGTVDLEWDLFLSDRVTRITNSPGLNAALPRTLWTGISLSSAANVVKAASTAVVWCGTIGSGSSAFGTLVGGGTPQTTTVTPYRAIGPMRFNLSVTAAVVGPTVYTGRLYVRAWK